MIPLTFARLPVSPNRALLRAAALLALVAPPASIAAQPAAADLIVTNARVYTVDDARPVVEAFAVRAGRIAFIGDTRGALALQGPQSRVLDLGGRTVIPGMVDAHGHVANLGASLANVDLTGASSYDEIVARVAARAKTVPAGQWILGRGWDQNRWGDRRFPTHEKLTAAVPNHPVYLTRVDGHAGLANKRAMDAAGITAAATDPSGGRIERGSDGSPTGVFVDNAQPLVRRAVPPQTRDQLKAQVMAAIAEGQRWGLTGTHDAGSSAEVIEIYEELGRAGQLNYRMYVMIGAGRGDALASTGDPLSGLNRWFTRGPQSGLHGGTLWIRSIKLVADGALGSRGALLLEPYSDDPKNTGLATTDARYIQDIATRALRAGFQVNTHAIGDRANRVALDAYEAALTAVPTADHRFRIEHAQIVNYADIPRFARLGVIPSMQASHQTSDMYWAGARLGAERLLGAYAWRSLLDAGVVIPNGSDYPVEKVNPLISFHASVSRQDGNDWPAGGWYPEQRMTREEALKSMTIWPAWAAFQEKELGSLAPGKLADFVVLDQDIMRVPAELMLRTRVLSTWLGGKPVYEAK